ncbi:MAG: NAD(P)/FAD-dependent oxidoreductase, partial [Sodalis sp. (in: enterobacteria)]|uniref:NAD(P)/FAD-dependent oxidoreductase n=1 Tax=Sodalis sp. (in: enterobacteria) TaxID=1898979 RepID=UPI003F2BF57A
MLYGDTGHAGGYLQRLQGEMPVDSGLLFSPDNLQTPRAAAGRQTMSKPTLVVIGHGMVGQHFLEQIPREGLAMQYHIVLFGDKPVEAYDRVHSTNYFAGRNARALSLVTLGFMGEHDIDLRTGNGIVAIDRKRRCVRNDAAHETAYDRPIIATGSQAFVPPIPGHDSDGCFIYRTLADLDAIAARAKNARRGVVIGGALLGLEAANALRKLGLETHVVEFVPRLMALQLDDGGARL